MCSSLLRSGSSRQPWRHRAAPRVGPVPLRVQERRRRRPHETRGPRTSHARAAGAPRAARGALAGPRGRTRPPRAQSQRPRTPPSSCRLHSRKTDRVWTGAYGTAALIVSSAVADLDAFRLDGLVGDVLVVLRRDDVGENRKCKFRRGLRADVEAHGRVETCEERLRHASGAQFLDVLSKPRTAREEPDEPGVGLGEGFQNGRVALPLREDNDGIPPADAQGLRLEHVALDDPVRRLLENWQGVHDDDLEPQGLPHADDRLLNVVLPALTDDDEALRGEHRLDEHLQSPAAIRLDVDVLFAGRADVPRDGGRRVDKMNADDPWLAVHHRALGDLDDRPLWTPAPEGPADHLALVGNQDLESHLREGRANRLRHCSDRERFVARDKPCNPRPEFGSPHAQWNGGVEYLAFAFEPGRPIVPAAR